MTRKRDLIRMESMVHLITDKKFTVEGTLQTESRCSVSEVSKTEESRNVSD